MREEPPLPADGDRPAESGPSAAMLVRAKPIFLAARELQGEEREATIDGMCGGDASLRAVVETLLAAEQVPLRFDTLADDIVTARQAMDGLDVAGDAMAGTSIGRYRILEQVGEGAFGVVYLAQQERPAGGRVAIKILKLGMDTRQIVSRFEAERQALAMMDHPAIARVFDAGATQSGRPFFVMEFVRGEPITVFCDRRTFTIRQRLELFRLVCDGVQHAHQKGVIHRDIKPGNVLVAEVDGRPYPKIIDFGIAKATQGRSAGITQYTEQGQLMGTPAYMSPEQAIGDADIDTRTDVYSLGVLLFELMTGDTPIPSDTMRSTPVSGVQRLVAESDLVAPSSRIKDESAVTTVAARSRGVDVQRLRSSLRMEIDWIVLKSLERERSRRYGSAAELGADVARYLSDEAVLAAPPSPWYAMRKTARRYRGAVIAATAVMIALALGLVGTISMALEAREQASVARTAAKAESDRSKELVAATQFQSQMLARIGAFSMGGILKQELRERLSRAASSRVNPSGWRSGSTQEGVFDAINFTDVGTAFVDKAILRPAIAELEERFADMPRVNAQLRGHVAAAYESLGMWDLAISQYQRALDLYATSTLADSKEMLEVRVEITLLLKQQRQLAAAQDMAEGTLRDAIALLGVDHPVSLSAQTEVGNIHRLLGNADKAIHIQRSLLARCQRVLGARGSETLAVMNNLAIALGDDGQYDESERLYQDLIKLRLELDGPDHPRTHLAEHNLGSILLLRGDLDGAKAYLTRACDGRSSLMGYGHPRVLRSVFKLVKVLVARGEFSEAESLLRKVLVAQPVGEYLAQTHVQLGQVLQQAGRFPEAEKSFSEALTISQELGVPPTEQLRLLKDLYESWHRAEPNSGAGEKLTQIVARLDAIPRQTPGVPQRQLGEREP